MSVRHETKRSQRLIGLGGAVIRRRSARRAAGGVDGAFRDAVCRPDDDRVRMLSIVIGTVRHAAATPHMLVDLCPRNRGCGFAMMMGAKACVSVS